MAADEVVVFAFFLESEFEVEVVFARKAFVVSFVELGGMVSWLKGLELWVVRTWERTITAGPAVFTSSTNFVLW